MSGDRPIHASGTYRLGTLEVHRLGFGAMQITGRGIWGPPRDHDESIRVLQRVVELGVDLIDTADSYGPYVSEELIREALHPYGDVIVATKAGYVRPRPHEWVEVGNPAYLRQECEMSMRRLGVDCLDLLQLHRIDPKIPAEDQFGELAALRAEGKAREIGLSEVSVAEIEAARAIVPVVSVQNLYHLEERRSEDVLSYCAQHGIGFIPWCPIGSGRLLTGGGVLQTVATEIGATPAQVALAWLLQRSPAMLPIPGTSRVAHAEENCAAAGIVLEPQHVKALDDAAM